MNKINIILIFCMLDLISLFFIFIKDLRIKKNNRKLENVWVEELKNDPNITENYINGFIDGLKKVNKFYD